MLPILRGRLGGRAFFFFIQTASVDPSSAHSFNLINFSMLNYAVVFLLVSLVAAVLGFGVIAGTAATIAKVLFLVFLVLFIVSLIKGRRRN